MRFQKLCAALLSGIMAAGVMTTALPNSFNLFQINDIAITAEAESSMRRPCNSENPMWIVHIETWNTPDPQKIIRMIPEDIRPYVVFNISMSIYWDNTNHDWVQKKPDNEKSTYLLLLL